MIETKKQIESHKGKVKLKKLRHGNYISYGGQDSRRSVHII